MWCTTSDYCECVVFSLIAKAHFSHVATQFRSQLRGSILEGVGVGVGVGWGDLCTLPRSRCCEGDCVLLTAAGISATDASTRDRNSGDICSGNDTSVMMKLPPVLKTAIENKLVANRN